MPTADFGQEPQSMAKPQFLLRYQKRSKGDGPMSDALSPAVSDRICQHMNQDHAEAIAVYAQVYGQTPEATAAQMKSIDAQGMNLVAQVHGETVPVRIDFDHTLQDSEDAHQTLISMLKQARQTAQT